MVDKWTGGYELTDPKEIKVQTKHKTVSDFQTPQVYVQKRQNFDYVDEGYMRQIMNDFYPVWSWTIISWSTNFEEGQVEVHGRLTIVDEGFERNFDSVASHRIMRKRDSGQLVDLGNDMKSANTEAFKVAANRLCNVSDDVYRKSVLTQTQLDTLEGLYKQLPIAKTVIEKIAKHEVNNSNFAVTVEKLESLVKQQQKQNKETK
tara:strand:+ start:762 stop:1373 length:612 start_codon:yes stop_codon:yes gene_type:complete